MPKQPETAMAAAQRLRDSCHACAASKVKCSKDKPTCVRCTRRGTTCQYFATKRPGRKRNSNPLPIEVPTTPTTPTSWHGDFADNLMLGIFDQEGQSYVDSDIDPQSSSTPQWFSTAPVPDSAMAIDAVLGFEFGNWPLSPVSWASDLIFSTLSSEIPTSPTSFPGAPDVAKQSRSVDMATAPASNDIFSVFARNPSPEASPSSARSPSRPTKVFPHSVERPPSPGPTPGAPLPAEPPLNSSPGDCHTQALRLVMDRFQNRTTKEPRCGRTDPNKQPPSSQDTIGENKRTIEAVHASLECSCSAGDGNMLVMLCVAVLMVLDEYTIVARGRSQCQESKGCTGTPPTLTSLSMLEPSSTSSSSSSPQPAAIMTSSSDHRDWMTVNLILGELFRVQRAAKEIASRLEGYHDFHGNRRASIAEELKTRGANNETHAPFFFSAATCKEMAQDLKQRVRLLAKILIETC